MTKHVNCRDAGFDCDYEAEAENDDDLVQEVQEHAKKAHNADFTREDVMGIAVSV